MLQTNKIAFCNTDFSTGSMVKAPVDPKHICSVVFLKLPIVNRVDF